MKHWTSTPARLLWSMGLGLILVGCNSSSPQFSSPQPQAPTDLPSPSTANPLPAEERRIYLAENRVSFLPPVGFTAMTPEEIALKFPNTNPPQQVYANAGGTVAIAVTLSDVPLTPEQLPELKQVMESSLEQAQPELEWLERGFLEINGVRWLKLESITPALDANIRNDMYFTSLNGRMVGFNFNSTVEADDAVRTELLRSRDSIQIQP